MSGEDLRSLDGWSDLTWTFHDREDEHMGACISPARKEGHQRKVHLHTQAYRTWRCYEAPCASRAKVFSQKPGVDYDEVCVTVAKITSIRFLLALNFLRHYSFLQLDVKNEFMSGMFKEELYVEVLDRMRFDHQTRHQAVKCLMISNTFSGLNEWIYFDDMGPFRA